MAVFAVDRRAASALGAVYTRGWVIELMVDQAGYKLYRNLVNARAAEPAMGEGACLVFLLRGY